MKTKEILKFIERNLLPDKLSCSLKFKYAYGRWLNWKNPETFNEKIIWRLIYDRNSFYTLCSDKLKVRDYVKEKMGEEYLVPLLFYGKPKDINFDYLDIPFVIKTNNSMGKHYFIRTEDDYRKMDRAKIIKYFSKKLKQNYYHYSGEWQYKNIEPYIMIEEFLTDENGKKNRPLTDYKIHCFDGKVKFINVDSEKEIDKDCFDFERSCFDKDGKGLDFEFGYRNKYYNSINKIENLTQKQFKEMIRIAEKLSADFSYVRIDLYKVNNKIYFGEFTFTPTGGFGKFKPEIWDKYFGKFWRINK